ncbi:hypothetical protein [Streptomyces sp. NPDC004050]
MARGRTVRWRATPPAPAPTTSPPPTPTATKSMTGHMLGASGAVGALAALLALRDGAVPPTRNLDELDPHVEPDGVAGEVRTGRWSAAPANSFGRTPRTWQRRRSPARPAGRTAEAART